MHCHARDIHAASEALAIGRARRKLYDLGYTVGLLLFLGSVLGMVGVLS